MSGHGHPEYTIKVGGCWCVVFLSSMEQSYVCALSLCGCDGGKGGGVCDCSIVYMSGIILV